MFNIELPDALYNLKLLKKIANMHEMRYVYAHNMMTAWAPALLFLFPSHVFTMALEFNVSHIFEAHNCFHDGGGL